ncbi:MAG TPA: VOC family protein [Acidimicrobiia bacterium]|nr:VOC family protein [Acidimicrobiia bacterium]
MEKVNGIGGLFFRSENPAGLADWYEQHLGVKKTPQSYDEMSWWQAKGPTVFAPFELDTEYFDSSKQWMVNFRVDDLDAMVAQLEEAGITVDVAPETYPNGRFAHLSDPEGNRIELWEPVGHDRDGPA